jgi:hypothetical protein
MTELKFATREQTAENITRFEAEISRNEFLQRNLSRVHSWYAIKDETGSWTFGPSEFVGYQKLTAKSYEESYRRRSGTDTEPRLRQWFRPVSPKEPLYPELFGKLCDLLSKYEKRPRSKVRINIPIEGDVDDLLKDAVVDLIVGVAGLLTTTQRHRIRSSLARN